MIYTLVTTLCTFEIRPQRNNPKRVELWVGSECFGSYASAHLAAADVAAHASGYDLWDAAGHFAAADKLDAWHRHNVSRAA